MPRDGDLAFLNHSVGKVPGRPLQRIELPSGSTVAEALDKAGVKAENGFSLTVNNQPATPGDRLNEDSSVLVTRRIRGN